MYPARIRPLLPSGDDQNKREHLTEYCQKCKELGRNCRRYAPQAPLEQDDGEEEEEEDCPDDVSVRSDAASISDLDDDDMDARQTPVPSDEETNEEFLSGKIGNLDPSGKKPK